MAGRRRFVGTLGRDGAVITLHDPYAGIALEAEPEAVIGMADGAVISVDRDARTIELLAAPGSALAAIWGIAFEAGMDPMFPDAVEEEVAAHLSAPGLDDPALEDREAVPFVTIDGPTARDLDQAIAVQREGDGFLILYAIADAAHVAPPGSAIFAEALRRGASFYLPGLSIPMLPRALSEGITSLNPDVPRRAMLFELRVGPAGAGRGTRVLRARIRSRAKLSFGQVQELLDAPDTSPLAGRDYTPSLFAMREAGLALQRESESRDVVRYRRTEVDVRLEGLRFVVVDALRDAVELYNEQVSLLCNREGARLLLECGDDGVQPIYRVHPPPDPLRVAGLERTIQALVRAHDLPEERFGWAGPTSKASLSTYLQQLPESGVGERVARAIHRQAVMVNLRSGYATHPSAHYGVGAEVYARFSSPMREVVGVFLHKEMLELLGAARSASSAGDVVTRDAVVIAANRAKARQKLVTDRANALVLDQLLGGDLGQPLSGEGGPRPIRRATVMGLAGGKVHVQLDAPTIDVKLWVADLAASLGEPLVEDEDGVRLLGAAQRVVLRVGDAVDLRVARRDERGRWILDLVPSSA
jgi:ribonuclease R